MNINELLKVYFGYDEFRQGQMELIEGTLNGRDALGIMPTGGGKSLCYQLPAVAMDGVTIVISPLISLMKDQVGALKEVGISAEYINSTQGYSELMDIVNNIRMGKYKIIYVAPERLNTPLFIDLIKDIRVSMVAIDEAHCISQWGHDFRPSYLEIPRFIESLDRRPVVTAFTATATKQVVNEIKKLIRLQKPIEIITGFDRPNLYYQVIKVSKKFKHLLKYLNSSARSDAGIIYCATRKNVESVTKKLNEEGFKAVAYHGGMNSDERQENQDDFILGRKNIMVATNAFGMGIDKPDVRFVIHYNMPRNMEAYYQEAGRAGRDGEKSDCILMYSPSDIVKQKLIIESNTFDPKREEILYTNLQYLIDYCHTNDCLRDKILNYFGEDTKLDNCENCSNCLDESEMIDITIEAQKVLSCVYRLEQRYGVNVVTQVLRGSKIKKLLEADLDKVSTYGIMTDYNNHTIREIIMTLASKGYIYITADKYPILKLTNNSMDVLKGKVKVFHKKDLIHGKAEDKKDTKLSKTNIDFDKGLFNKLKELRFKIATEKEVPPYVIFHDSTLKEMAAYLPQDKNTFLDIKGVGEKRYDSYGETFIEIIKEYCKENELKPTEKRNSSEVKIEDLDNNEEKSNRYDLTYSYYLEELSLKELSDRRGFTQGTIIKHLKKCQEDGKVIDWNRFITDKEKEKKILATIKEIGADKLSPIKTALDEDISYEDIRIVICKYKAE